MARLSDAPVAAARVAPRLSEMQQQVEAARLGQAVPSLGVAYAHALARWAGNPVLRLTRCCG